MKSIFASLSKMVFCMFGLDRILFTQSGPSEKQLLNQLQQLSMRHSTLSKLEQSFMQSMDSCQAQKLLEAEIEAKRAEAELVFAQAMNHPHRIYQPALRHDGLEWIAQWGYDENGNPFLVGRGSSPSAALTDFDYKWLGLDPPA